MADILELDVRALMVIFTIFSILVTRMFGFPKMVEPIAIFVFWKQAM